jgi:DNA-binding XRE family transcriptional regulator
MRDKLLWSYLREICDPDNTVINKIMQVLHVFGYSGHMSNPRVKTDAAGVVLREIRTEKNLSQEEVAMRMDMARSYISYLESGRRYPSLDMLIALARALEVSPGEMLERIAMRAVSGRASPLAKQPGPKL